VWGGYPKDICPQHKEKKMAKKLNFLLTLLLFSNLYSLTITPARQEFLVEPGKKITGEYLVTNDTDKKIVVDITTKDWFISEENKDLTCDKWLKLKTKKQVILDKGETKKISFSCLAPKTAKGALFAMISANSKPYGEDSALNIMLSVPVILILKGTEIYETECKELKLFVENNKFLQISFEVENKGNVHLRPKGYCKLVSKDNNQQIIIEIPEGRPIYPKMKRTIIARKEIELIPEGVYNGKIELNCGNILLSKDFELEVFLDKDNNKNVRLIK
jgi:hypothetical protein